MHRRPRSVARMEDDQEGFLAGEAEAVRVWLLGGFQVLVGSRKVDEGEWRLKKARSLIKLLALAPGHCMHREMVMDRLWPDLGRAEAANNLRRVLYVARRAFEPSPATPYRYLRLKDEELALCPDGPLWVDVEAFEEAAEAARRIREPAVYRVAIELYSGEFLPEDRYEEWAESRRAELRRLYLALLVEMAALLEERGEHDEAIEASRRVLSHEPLQEEAHAGLMRLYVLRGRKVEALRQYERLKESLSRELGTEPSTESKRLHGEILSGRFSLLHPSTEDRPPEETPGAGPHNLPAAQDVFVGREREIIEIKRALSMTNLLTLTGAGGSGKTRLTLEVAKGLVGFFPDGTWLVELAPLSEGELVPQAVASTLGIREQPGHPLTDTLVRAMREKKILLVLDNCEHLIDAAAQLVDTLLSSCPRLRVLATSREPLGVAGEINWRVPPLSVPDTGRPPAAEDLLRYEAVRLFLERARQRLPTFELSQENASSVAEVCRKLDGLPLAIELASARITALAIEQVAERLEESLKLLTGGDRTAAPRQQTMRATLQWSRELLPESERVLFRRLSVFAGGWTLEAVEAVGSGSGIERGEVLDLLSRLVDKSLVVAETSSERGALRYRMLEPIRQYAREKLEESGAEADAVRNRHLLWCLTLAEQAEPELHGPRQKEGLDRLEREHDNLQAALGWAFEREVEARESIELGTRLAAALWRFWYKRGHLITGHRWLEAALSKSDMLSAVTRAKALSGAGMVAWERGDYASAKALHEESLGLHRKTKNKRGVAFSLNHLGLVALYQGDYALAKALHEESLTLQRQLDDAGGRAASLHNLGLVALYRGDYEPAKTLIEESLSLFSELEDRWAISILLNNLGLTALHQGDDEQAVRFQEESLVLRKELNDRGGIAECLEGLAGVAGVQGKAPRAVRLWAAAEAVREGIGAPLPPGHRPLYETYLTAARNQMGDASWEAAWAEGKMMTLERAVEYALEREEQSLPAAPSRERASSGRSEHGLTRREREVADLVARGLTNRRIASELVLSNRTVETHVRNILKKLGLESRAQLAVWAAEQRLGSE